MNATSRSSKLLIVNTAAAALFFAVAAAAAATSAADIRTGEFRLKSSVAGLAGESGAAAVASVIEPDDRITWELYVPESYRPERPAGLMVYISPTSSGDIPRRWKRVLDDHNLIWIAANRSGNRVLTTRRAIFALLAPTLAGRHYAIDPERIYVTGLSGGGKMASMVAADYPNLFKGAIFNCGVMPLDSHPPKDLELFRQRHFVFVTGTLDQALQPTIDAHEEYLEAGATNSKLMVIEKMTHRNPGSYDFEEAFAYLDSRLASPETGDASNQ